MQQKEAKVSSEQSETGCRMKIVGEKMDVGDGDNHPGVPLPDVTLRADTSTGDRSTEICPDNKDALLHKGKGDPEKTQISRVPSGKGDHKDSDVSTDKKTVPLAHVMPQDTWRMYRICLCVSILAYVTRLYRIEEPPHICWDETHFGKMGSWYINRTFFFDVHPPLGKMLIGLAGHLTGYNGSFAFSKPGDLYEDVPYVGMRIFCALLGSAVVPFSFLIVWELSHSIIASMITGFLVMLDTGTLTLSRYILLDPILLCFIMAATYSTLKLRNAHDKLFSVQWWTWACVTGVFLSCSVGVKFVGLFVVLLAGVTTVLELWHLLGRLELPMSSLAAQFAARVACLILLPVILYMAFFAVHFTVLSKSGNGDGFFSSAFQSQLEGNKLYNISMPENVAYGSKVTLKHQKTGGGYLHSHYHLYPEELPPRQQQITTYTHKDDNNYWIIKKFDVEPTEEDKPEFVTNGDYVRLEHFATRRNLHSHREPAPITKRHYQVSAYGVNGTGDANDVWIVDIVGAPKGAPLKTVRSRIRLIHYHVRCVLQSNDKKLPKWGFEQMEVTCSPSSKGQITYWNIEEVVDPRLPSVSFQVYRPSFLEKFIESHAVMFQGNSGLKPKEGEVTSVPWQWPVNYKGQLFSGRDHMVYLLGNPVIFWGNLVVLGLFLLLYTVHALRRQRGCHIQPNLLVYREQRFSACWWLFLGWILHYLPFWAMGRVLYFHHYFPAFLFNCMLTGRPVKN
ncbi:protein O-mannosyl-transferase 2-like isoform X1 [Liolophura sinensis]|uniref:protein O-mannosyl-transferase 2-like isoform X1 n=1 Tax=Liolophura sinensis TaxID=3198878 RepID=UPI003158FEE6